jgi:hypothetical protein
MTRSDDTGIRHLPRHLPRTADAALAADAGHAPTRPEPKTRTQGLNRQNPLDLFAEKRSSTTATAAFPSARVVDVARARRTSDFAALVDDVTGDLGDALEVLDREGGTYARRYADWLINNGPRPNRPAGMPVKAAELIRDLVIEAAHMRQCVPARYR